MPGRSPGRSSRARWSRPRSTAATRTGARIVGAAGNARLADAAVLVAAGLPAPEAERRTGRPAAVDPDRLRVAIAGTLVFDGPAGGPATFDRAAVRRAMDAPECLVATRPRSGRRLGRGVRLRPHGDVRARELRVHDMSEVLVIKLGGSTIADQAQVLGEVAVVARRRPVVLVHGGGRRMTEWLERLGVPSKFEGGLRVTDAQSLEVAAAVLRGVVNSELVAGLRDLGVDAVGLSGVDGGLLIAERIPAVGLVAHVVGLRRDLLDAVLVGGQVPVVAPLARDEDGVVCNVNADDVAAGIAAGLGARQLVLLTDVDGVRDADGRRLDTLTVGEAEELITSGVIAGGMVPKVRAALGALGWDEAEAVIADSAAPSALERALADPTFGTRITARRPAGAGVS